MALTITWKGNIPGRAQQEGCEGAAYEALSYANGTAAGMVFVEVLIRGGPHATTRSGDKRKRAYDPRHCTMDFKTAEQQVTGKHMPCHVYLKKGSYEVTRVVWFGESYD